MLRFVCQSSVGVDINPLEKAPELSSNMAARQGLSIASTIKLNSGHAIPQLGFGAGDIDDVVAACKIAFSLGGHDGEEVKNETLIGPLAGYRHVDTARFYGSEKAVAEAVKTSCVPSAPSNLDKLTASARQRPASLRLLPHDQSQKRGTRLRSLFQRRRQLLRTPWRPLGLDLAS